MRPRPRTVLATSLLTLLPLLLTAPALADGGPNVPPINVQADPPPDPPTAPEDAEDVATNYGSLPGHDDAPPEGAAYHNILPTDILDILPPPPGEAPLLDEPPVPISSSYTHSTSGDCRWSGTARWLAPKDNTCLPMHWEDGVVFINDTTGRAWPVRAAVDKWNTGWTRLRMVYGCPDKKALNCVTVKEGDYGKTKWVGRAPYWEGTDHHFHSGMIQLNNDVRLGWAGHMMTIVHELGHIAGLGHEMKDVGPMWYQNNAKWETPNAAEINQLRDHTYVTHLHSN